MAPETGALQETLILVGLACLASKLVGELAAVMREGYSYVFPQPASWQNVVFLMMRKGHYRVHS